MSKMAPDPRDERIAHLEMECAKMADDESRMRAALLELADEFEKSAHISVFENDTDAYIGIQYRVANILRDLARKD